MFFIVLHVSTALVYASMRTERVVVHVNGCFVVGQPARNDRLRLFTGDTSTKHVLSRDAELVLLGRDQVPDHHVTHVTAPD